MPYIKFCPPDANGNPLAAGLVHTYQGGTTTPQNTWTDSTGGTPNTNPVVLNSAGCAQIWVNNLPYKFVVADASDAPLYTVDNVTEAGLSALAKAVLLAPAGGSNQTISGPLTATFFTQSTAHVTSPGVRVAILAPTTVLDTASNPPSVTVTAPAVANQVYTVPDPGTLTGNFVISPGTTSNTLDCTKVGLSCIRTAYIYLGGAGCNNTSAGLAWDNFGTNSPDALCVTGTNIQKGVMGLRSAATKYQENTNSASASGTCTVTYPQATIAGDLLIGWTMLDGTKTISSVTDGTNAYTAAFSATSGAGRLALYYFNGSSTAMAASSTLTFTYSAGANAACGFMAYKDVKTSGALDVTATNSGVGTAVTTGTTVGTAQNTELVISLVGTLASAPTIAFSSGNTGHSTIAQSTNVEGSTQGRIQQATSTQADTFTLGTSATWISGIATFKANIANLVIAQRQILLPAAYLASQPVNATMVWQAPAAPTGTVNVKLGAAVVCTAAGSTDDPAFNTPTTATALVNASAANIITTTALSALTTTGCAAGNLIHIQADRHRYDAADTYEGYVYMNGLGFTFGSSQ